MVAEGTRPDGPSILQLEDEYLRIRFDLQGRLLELANNSTGNRYVTAASHAPWRMFYRTEHGEHIEISPEELPAIALKDGGLTLVYESLHGMDNRASDKRLKIELQVRILPDEDRLTWTARIDNREPEVEVIELWLPWIYGIEDMGLGRGADAIYWPEGSERRIPNPYGKAWQVTYPEHATEPWFSLGNGREGLSLASHARTPITTTFNMMPHSDGATSVSCIQYPSVKTGETWTSEPIVLSVYRGGLRK